MSAEPTDPKRWAELGSDAPGELHTLLARARDDVATPAQLQSLASRLPLEPVLAPSPVPEPSGALARFPQLGKLALLVAGAGAIGLVAWQFSRAPDAQPPRRGSDVTNRRPEPVPVDPRSRPEPSPAAIPTAPTTPLAPESSSVVPQAPKSAAAPRLGEAELLERARRALAKDPQAALSYTRQHRARFPSGVLRQEREVIAIEALRRLGRAGDAQRKAAEFQKAFPDSAHRRAVESGRGK